MKTLKTKSWPEGRKWPDTLTLDVGSNMPTDVHGLRDSEFGVLYVRHDLVGEYIGDQRCPQTKLGCDHEPNTKCETCGLDVDKYGNTEDDFRNCSFPDCGCDGARLCMAKTGASENAQIANVEGMYQRTDHEAKAAKCALVWICAHDGKQPHVAGEQRPPPKNKK